MIEPNMLANVEAKIMRHESTFVDIMESSRNLSCCSNDVRQETGLPRVC